MLRIEDKTTTIAFLRIREKSETETPYHDSLSSHDDDYAVAQLLRDYEELQMIATRTLVPNHLRPVQVAVGHDSTR